LASWFVPLIRFKCYYCFFFYSELQTWAWSSRNKKIYNQLEEGCIFSIPVSQSGSSPTPAGLSHMYTDGSLASLRSVHPVFVVGRVGGGPISIRNCNGHLHIPHLVGDGTKWLFRAAELNGCCLWGSFCFFSEMAFCTDGSLVWLEPTISQKASQERRSFYIQDEGYVKKTTATGTRIFFRLI
jgi:hypothetical protein